jgi:hypothetical protein
MLLIDAFAALGLVGFFSSFFMGITVVGVCRYGNRYQRFFERLKKLGALDTIKEMSKFYFDLLNRFVGKNVGMKQPGVIRKAKYFGVYIEHLLLLYWIGATILVLAFRPVEPEAESVNSLHQAAAFVMLLTINILSDATSLIWTKRCIAILANMVPDKPLTTKRLFLVLAQDIAVAAVLMFVVQLISNGLYPVQIGRPEDFFKDMFDIKTAFKPYAAVDPNFSTMQFPGQLFITCTTAFLPTLLFYASCLMIFILMPFYRFLLFILDLFNPRARRRGKARRRTSCSPLGYIGSLLGVFGFAVASASLFVSAWPLIRSN